MNRNEIETQIGNYLNRLNDPQVTSAIPFWFSIAHHDAQRLRNYKFQETTAAENLVSGQESVCAQTDIKEPYNTYSFDGVTQKLISFYYQTDIATLRAARHGFLQEHVEIILPSLGPVQFRRGLHLFSIWAENIEIYPTPGPDLDGKEFRMDYYRWVDPPGEDCQDWLTLHGADYILYRSLVEAIPFLDSTDQRLTIWGALKSKAEKDLMGVDVSATWATASLQMRG